MHSGGDWQSCYTNVCSHRFERELRRSRMSGETAGIVSGTFIAGEWHQNKSSDVIGIINPATSEIIARVGLSGSSEIDAAVAAASKAFPSWRRTPPQDRIQFMFRFRELLLKHQDEIARTITKENGKTLSESKA